MPVSRYRAEEKSSGVPLHFWKEQCPNNAPVGHSVDASRPWEKESVWSVALANTLSAEAPSWLNTWCGEVIRCIVLYSRMLGLQPTIARARSLARTPLTLYCPGSDAGRPPTERLAISLVGPLQDVCLPLLCKPPPLVPHFPRQSPC